MAMAAARADDRIFDEAAWDDWAERVARDDPDWNLYLPGDERPKLPWWRRLLKL